MAAGDAPALPTAQRAFQQAMRKHIGDIRDKYIVPGETAELALMFLPSEAIYAELHANFGGIVDEILSRARLDRVADDHDGDAQHRARRAEGRARCASRRARSRSWSALMMGDMKRLQERVDKLKTHFAQTEKDLREIDTSTVQIMRRGERILAVDLGEQPEALPKP